MRVVGFHVDTTAHFSHVHQSVIRYLMMLLILQDCKYCSSMLHGNETWPVRKENEMALQRAEMRMVRWMCGIKLKDRVSNKELTERLGIVDIRSLLQQNRL